MTSQNIHVVRAFTAVFGQSEPWWESAALRDRPRSEQTASSRLSMCRLPRAHTRKFNNNRILSRPATPMPCTAFQIRDQLLQALDIDYNVIDMPAVVEVIGILERTVITKEVLETTRLGKYINELRRKTSNESVARRAKDLVRKWRDLIREPPDGGGGGRQTTCPAPNGVRPPNNPASLPLHPAISRAAGQISPGQSARKSQPASPSSRVSSLSPDPRLLISSANASPAISPAISPRLLGLPVPVEAEQSPPQKRGRGRPPLPRPLSSTPSTPTATPSPTTRGRGRPPKNKPKRAHPVEVVPSTNQEPDVDYKRLRLDDSSSISSAAPIRVNGTAAHAHGDDEVEVVLTDCDRRCDEVPTERKKRGRKKGSKNASTLASVDEEDIVKEKMASVVRHSKVKTTWELLQSIQKESSLDHLRNKTLSSLGVDDDKVASTIPTKLVSSANDRKQPLTPANITKKLDPEHINKFLRTNHESAIKKPSKVEVVDLEDDLPPSPTSSEIIDVERIEPPLSKAPKPPETVEEILSKLPEINPDEILWDEPDEELSSQEPITVDRLHSEHICNVNGIENEGCAVPNRYHGMTIPLEELNSDNHKDHDDDNDDDNFREWQECVSKWSYNGELLHILPYVIID